jgi:hypothetical protein
MRPGPPNDPYSSLDPVQHLDNMLFDLGELFKELGDTLRDQQHVSELQRAALELVPAAGAIANSIRVLIREGYLVSALVLVRPLFERIATLCYLEDHQEALALWRQGWPHHSRPSLKQRVAAMTPGAPPQLLDRLAAAVSGYNGLVHGDPAAAQQSLMMTPDGLRYSMGRDYQTPGRAASIATETGVAVALLIARTGEIFERPTDDQRS